jgi:hypothetical protein
LEQLLDCVSGLGTQAEGWERSVMKASASVMAMKFRMEVKLKNGIKNIMKFKLRMKLEKTMTVKARTVLQSRAPACGMNTHLGGGGLFLRAPLISPLSGIIGC